MMIGYPGIVGSAAMRAGWRRPDAGVEVVDVCLELHRVRS